MTRSTLSQLALQERIRREILQRSDLIPPLPDFVVRMLALLGKPDTEPRHLEQQIQSDQVLVAKMLAMVNSPFYGLSRSIQTIRDAVMFLGFRGVRSLVLATSTAKFLQRDYSCYGHDAKGLWTHAACVAGGAKFLAQRAGMGEAAAEEALVAGLLHDIGKMLLVGYLNDALRDRPRPECTVTELETQLIGIDHTEAGALVTAKWNLSPVIQEVIKASHDGSDASNPGMLAVVRLSDAVAHECGFGYLPGRAPKPVFLQRDRQVLHLEGEAWESARVEAARVMADARASLAPLGS